MNEDAQPNERSFNKKGASVPVIRSTRTAGRSRGTLQPGGYGTRYYQRPLNRPHAGPYPFQTPSKNLQYIYPPKRSKSIYNVPYSKHRQLDRKNSHSRYVTPNVRAFPASKPSAQTRKFPGQLESLGFSVASQFKEGVPNSQCLRSDQRIRQGQDLITEPDASFHFVQSVLDNESREHSSHPLSEDFSPDFTSTGVDAFSMSGTLPNNIYDEIIIVENIDALDNTEGNFRDPFPPSSRTQSSNLPPRSRTSLTMVPASLEPPRVFKSGVFSFCSTESDSLPSSATPYLRFAASSVPSVFANPRPPTHDATTLLPVKRGSSSPSFFGGFPSCVSDLSIEISRRAPSDHDTSFMETSDNSVSPCNIMSEDASTLLPLSQYDKVRRFILFNTRSIMSVSMRGSVDLIDVGSLRHQSSLKTRRPDELIDDACIVQAGDDFLVIFGHAREHEQLSWYHSRCGTDKGEVLFLPRPWTKTKKGGVSAVTSMMQPMQFATGGYDHTVHLWEIKSDLSSASPRPLAITHTSQVQSLLAIRDTSHKLISAGADCNAHIWDLSSERVVNTVRVSNAIYHLHTLTSPFCTLLEVAHRELQFEVRDHRLVPEHPVLRFGYTTDKVHGRYIKGAVTSQSFASGSRDGYVRLWDLRNVHSAATMAATHHGQKIIQAVFKEANLIVCTETGQTSLFRYEH